MKIYTAFVYWYFFQHFHLVCNL